MIDGAGGPGADGLAGTSLPGGEGVDVVVLAGGTGRRLRSGSMPVHAPRSPAAPQRLPPGHN